MLNRGYAYSTIVGSDEQGRTLLKHLARVYPHSSADEWQEALERREVTLDGVAATGSELLRQGQRLVWKRPPWVEADVPQNFGVLFEDEHVLAVSKPSGLPTLPGGGFLENTLLRLVQRRSQEANPVHRLGRATSGIVLFAKTAEAAARLSANWNTDKVEKIYRAVAQGIAEKDAYEIVTPIGLVPHPLIGSVWAARVGGKVRGDGDRSRGEDDSVCGDAAFGAASSNQDSFGVHRASAGGRSTVWDRRTASRTSAGSSGRWRLFSARAISEL
jgi:23S rRNA pseudouridine1911/1915/1917 synthase